MQDIRGRYPSVDGNYRDYKSTIDAETSLDTYIFYDFSSNCICMTMTTNIQSMFPTDGIEM